MGATASAPMDGHGPQAWAPQAGDAAPVPEERARQNTPLWMETSTVQPAVRRGAAPPPRSGLHTLLFFGLIVFVVGAAGFGAIALWGPEKTIKNRTQFATNPPAAMALPSLSASSAASAAPPVPEAASVAPDESPPPADTSPKKGKKAPKAGRRTR